jgi:hypothetical protein
MREYFWITLMILAIFTIAGVSSFLAEICAAAVILVAIGNLVGLQRRSR